VVLCVGPYQINLTRVTAPATVAANSQSTSVFISHALLSTHPYSVFENVEDLKPFKAKYWICCPLISAASQYHDLENLNIKTPMLLSWTAKQCLRVYILGYVT